MSSIGMQRFSIIHSKCPYSYDVNEDFIIRAADKVLVLNSLITQVVLIEVYFTHLIWRMYKKKCMFVGDTASNLGNAMDELMRHQPSLRTDATKAIIKVGNPRQYILYKHLVCMKVLSPMRHY